jgi:hypothetical protein
MSTEMRTVRSMTNTIAANSFHWIGNFCISNDPGVSHISSGMMELPERNQIRLEPEPTVHGKLSEWNLLVRRLCNLPRHFDPHCPIWVESFKDGLDDGRLA